uniref:Sulfatase N-terminal domain-containing protein n=1 Tax=Glossina brevipalpis TaxID=37001 RepID=A0A1A9X099_9MUSC
MSLAIEKSLSGNKKAGLRYCVGNRQYGEYVYDMALQFSTRFQYESHFGLFWANSFSHNDYSVPATMDAIILKYLKEMETLGIFDNTIVFFLSDHGARWGELLKLSEGFLEERLPTFFISIPKWFHNTYPELIRNLQTNCQRLTTPYDIYMTMQHLLEIGDQNFDIKPATGCALCQSLFQEIPEDRTCFDARIPEKWCTCRSFNKSITK